MESYISGFRKNARISIPGFGILSSVPQGRLSKLQVCHSQNFIRLFSALRIKRTPTDLDKIDAERGSTGS
jgi:hypothetical protein